MTKNPTDKAAPFMQVLPSSPDLEMQKKRAKALVRGCLSGDAEVLAMVAGLHPNPPQPENIRLSDAQLVVARSYGIASWPRLKQKIDQLTKSVPDQFADAVSKGDVAAVDALVDANPGLKERINDPMFAFGQRAVHAAARHLEMLDWLLANGADINLKSEWEKGGFGILEIADPGLAGPLIDRGAAVDIWAAAHLGMLDRVKTLLAEDPALVNAKGGDGKRPLHYAATKDIAMYLLDHGAEIDALDDDHGSTPAQYMVGGREALCRFLVENGAKSDLLMASALGDADLVSRHLADDPKSIGMRVSQDWFPMIDTAGNGGHIYQWTIGFYLSAFDIARKRGHEDVLVILREHAPAAERLADAIWSDDRQTVEALLAVQPDLVRSGGELLHRQLADAARHNDLRAVRMMLSLGFPVDATGQHKANALHFAAFHGNPDLVEALLEQGAPIDARDSDFGGTPLGWAIHGSQNGWPGTSMDEHGEAARLLLAAGSQCDREVFPTGHEGVDKVLKDHLF